LIDNEEVAEDELLKFLRALATRPSVEVYGGPETTASYR
jgi:hypothetical protein